MLLKPNPENICFGCGGANARGMQLTFEQDDASNKIRGAFRLGPEYQGGTGFIHGGIIATVLDEVMGKVCRFRGVRAVTAELERRIPEASSGGRGFVDRRLRSSR